MGVFKEELTNIIFEPHYIQNRNDLPEYWEKLSKELFKNQFPKISDRITKDVKEVYFPTESVQYYDNYKLEIEIDLIDPVKEIVKIKETTKFLLHPKEGKKEFKHEYRNSIKCLTNEEDTSFHLVSLKINSEEFVQPKKKKILINQKKAFGLLVTEYGVILENSKIYDICRIVEKTYCLKCDNVISVRNNVIRNDINVKFFFDGIKIEFHESGTLKAFQQVREKGNYLEMNYDGIVYPKQGFLAIINKI